MALDLTAPPIVEPVSLAQMKLHLRVDDDLTEDDALIQLLITAARRHAEMVCNASFVTQSWRLTLDAFPGGAGLAGYTSGAGAVIFERGPVQSVDSIRYTDLSGTNQLITSPGMPDYAVDLAGRIARMSPAFGKVWPIPMPQIGAVRINYTAGYGDTADAVPEGVRHWIMVRAGTCYRNREEVALVTRGGRLQALPFMDGLLDPYRTISV